MAIYLINIGLDQGKQEQFMCLILMRCGLGDITYIRMSGGFMYLAAIIDWHSRAILSYKLSNSMDITLVTDILQEALGKYPAPQIFNSDQASQYTSYEHTGMLKK